MIEWTPIAVNEKPLLRGKKILPEYSAAVIGSSVVLRFYGGGLTALSVALTTIPFAAASEAAAWIDANRIELATTNELDPQFTSVSLVTLALSWGSAVAQSQQDTNAEEGGTPTQSLGGRRQVIGAIGVSGGIGSQDNVVSPAGQALRSNKP